MSPLQIVEAAPWLLDIPSDLQSACFVLIERGVSPSKLRPLIIKYKRGRKRERTRIKGSSGAPRRWSEEKHIELVQSVDRIKAMLRTNTSQRVTDKLALRMYLALYAEKLGEQKAWQKRAMKRYQNQLTIARRKLSR